MPRFVLISDTHGSDPILPYGEILIHAGDWCGMGTRHSLKSDGVRYLSEFCEQLKRWKQSFDEVVVISGNHDFIAEAEPLLTRQTIEATGARYLNDSGITFSGVSLWGSPVQPWFCDWAFNRQRGSEIKRHWDLIPCDTGLLITHGPPHGILDLVESEALHVGCEELLIATRRIKPKIHLFGHIHEGYGEVVDGPTRYINASVLDVHYRLRNQPIVAAF